MNDFIIQVIPTQPEPTMYHAGKYKAPLCGTKGSGNGYNVVALPAKEWNKLAADQRCSKCVAKIQLLKKAAA